MRVAILLQKSANSGTPISEDVAFFIANMSVPISWIGRCTKPYRSLCTLPQTSHLYWACKRGTQRSTAAQNKQVTIENIQKTVADFYRLKIIDLLSKKRTRVIARPRQIAMSLARELTQFSLPEIGMPLGEEITQPFCMLAKPSNRWEHRCFDWIRFQFASPKRYVDKSIKTVGFCR